MLIDIDIHEAFLPLVFLGNFLVGAAIGAAVGTAVGVIIEAFVEYLDRRTAKKEITESALESESLSKEIRDNLKSRSYSKVNIGLENLKEDYSEGIAMTEDYDVIGYVYDNNKDKIVHSLRINYNDIDPELANELYREEIVIL